MSEVDQPVVIELATPDDAAAICDVRDKAWLKAYPNPELGITEEDVLLMAQGPNQEYLPRRIAYLEEYLGNKNDTDPPTFVARLNSKVVGFIDPRIDERDRRRIGAIYVVPEMQGQGIGSKLMEQVLRWYGREQDIYLEVVSYNQNAINFYKHFGFEETGAQVPEEEDRPDYLKSLPQIEMVLSANTAK